MTFLEEGSAKTSCDCVYNFILGVQLLYSAYFGQGTGIPIAMTDISCTSTENRLPDCSYSDANALGSCSHAHDAGMRCRPRMLGCI